MRLKSEFESLRKRGRFSEPISRAAELHIISTLRPRKALRNNLKNNPVAIEFTDSEKPPLERP